MKNYERAKSNDRDSLIKEIETRLQRDEISN